MMRNQMIKEHLNINLHRAANATGKTLMSNFLNYSRLRVALVLSSLLLIGLLVAPFASADEPASQQAFPSPDAAAKALVAADKADDMKALARFSARTPIRSFHREIQLPTRTRVTTSRDRYDEMHRLEYDDQGRVILYIGAEQLAGSDSARKESGRMGVRHGCRQR